MALVGTTSNHFISRMVFAARVMAFFESPNGAAAHGCSEALLASDLLEIIALDDRCDAVLDSAPLLASDSEIFRQGMKIAVTDSP
jgi:hypothetical protein